MLELYRLNLFPKRTIQPLNSLFLGKVNSTICQRRLKSNIYNSQNNFKINLSNPLNKELNTREFTRSLKYNGIGSKNNEMWKEYKAIDPRIIRPVDGSEFFVVGWYINIIDVFPKISTEEFKKRAEENFSKIELFNLALKRIQGHLFFIRKPFKIHLEEIEYTEAEEIENYLKNEEDMILPYEPIQEKNDEGVQALFNFKICQLEKSNQTKITLSINHTISDGRTAFTIMDYIRKIINGESIEKNDEGLTNFGGIDRFKGIDESFYNTPKIWNEISHLSLLPKIKPPFKYIRPHIIFDYKPISKFIHENGISIQAMLMAALSRATRRYYNLPKETPIWNSTPSDTRFSPYATEEFRKRKLYCNIGVMYVKLVGQSNLMEDLKYCMAQLKEAKKSNNDVRQLVCCSSIVDPKTLIFTPKEGFPNPFTNSIIISSNIGKVNGTIPLLTSSIDPNTYAFTVNSYHTDDKLFVALLRPINFDKAYIDIVTEEIYKIFIPENISKY
ncbi:hypothetical protein PIROE2DRAFT_61098 [Piromyces sp. E2]|nr:hypothetical protein PIROE2DRAFT_61098 [Piromyces sp. E2]|eukprot:OUM63719.1 hypothetical protein PIROE2DRAFT_61098 [Piromyces sp. E2]